MAERVNFGDILKAIENKLIADNVVQSEGQIIWSVNDDQIPQLTMQWDILLRAANGFGDTKDGGDYDLRCSRLVDVRIRSMSIADMLASNKAWITEQFIRHDQIINSIGNGRFEPLDANGKKITLQSIKLRSDLSPERKGTQDTWGDSVCILEIRYLPKVTPTNPIG